MADLTARMILELVDRLSGPAKTAVRRMGALTRSANNMAKSFERINEGGRKARRTIRQISAESRKLTNVRGARGRGGPLGDGDTPRRAREIWGRGTMATAGRELSRFGRNSARAMGAVLSVFIDFDQKMGDVAAVTRGITKIEFEAIRSKAKEIGEATKFTAGEAAGAFEMLGMAGLDAADQLAVVDDVMNLSAAGALGLRQATDIATDVMQGFNLEAKDMGRIADVMAIGATSATTTIAGLGKGLSKVAPVAAQLGISLEEATAFLAAFANMGLKGGIGGRSLRRILIGLVAPSKKASKWFERLKIDTTDASGAMKKPVEIFQEMTVSLRKLPEAKRIKALHGMFQAFGMVGAAGAVAQFNKAIGKTPEEAEKLNDILKILGRAMNRNGDAAAMSARRMDTMRGDSLKLKSALQGAAITIGEEFNEELRELIREVTEAVRGFAKWAKEHPVIIRMVIKLWASIAALAAAFGPLIVAVDTFVKLIMITKSLGLATSLNQAGAAAGATAGKIGGLAGKLGAMLPMIGLVTIGTHVMFSALEEHLKEVNRRILKLQETSKATFKDVRKNIPATLAAQTPGQLAARAEHLKGQLSREEARVRKEQEGLGVFDALVGRGVDMSAFQGLLAELTATQRELKKRREEFTGPEQFVGPTAEQAKFKLKVEVEDKRVRVTAAEAAPGVSMEVLQALGLQGAGG